MLTKNLSDLIFEQYLDSNFSLLKFESLFLKEIQCKNNIPDVAWGQKQKFGSSGNALIVGAQASDVHVRRWLLVGRAALVKARSFKTLTSQTPERKWLICTITQVHGSNDQDVVVNLRSSRTDWLGWLVNVAWETGSQATTYACGCLRVCVCGARYVHGRLQGVEDLW